jgi:hypothetical protein
VKQRLHRIVETAECGAAARAHRDDGIGQSRGRDRVAGGPGNDQFQMRDGAADQVDGGPGRDTCDCDRADTETDGGALLALA